jgi:hypothetical protein
VVSAGARRHASREPVEDGARERSRAGGEDNLGDPAGAPALRASGYTRRMKNAWWTRALCAAAAASLLTLAQNDPPKTRWYKGNLHTHTLNSDGDSAPDEVARWYREHRYDFLVLSDHNYLTDVGGLNATIGARDKFLLIPGEEVTDSFDRKPIHMNAYNPERLVEPRHGTSVAETIQNNTNEIRRAKGIPSLNHPNFGWAISTEDMLAVNGLGLFEVYNGHPMVNNPGGGGRASLEEMWDALLTANRRIHGIAVDDAHVFQRFGAEFSNPGHGWVVARAPELSAEAIIGAIERGDFYASTGVRLRDIVITGAEYRVEIDPADWEKTTTYFIGEGGQTLARSFERGAVYRFTGGEKYVRARVESSSGAKAWTQPAFR